MRQQRHARGERTVPVPPARNSGGKRRACGVGKGARGVRGSAAPARPWGKGVGIGSNRRRGWDGDGMFPSARQAAC